MNDRSSKNFRTLTTDFLLGRDFTLCRVNCTFTITLPRLLIFSSQLFNSIITRRIYLVHEFHDLQIFSREICKF